MECAPRRVGGRNVDDDFSLSLFSFAFSPAELTHKLTQFTFQKFMLFH